MIHLSNSRGHTQGAQPFTKRRADSPVARPSQPTLSDEVRSAGQPGAGSPRRLEPANRSVNRPKPAPQRPDRPTHRNRRTAIARSSHPDQLRSPTIPKTNKTADPPTSGPRRPVGEAASMGSPIRRQRPNREKFHIRPRGHHSLTTASLGAVISREPAASIWTCWPRTSVPSAARRTAKSHVARPARVW